MGKVCLDSKEREVQKGMTPTTGYCSCHLCDAKGIVLNVLNKKGKKSTQVSYPRTKIKGYGKDVFATANIRTSQGVRDLKKTANTLSIHKGSIITKKQYRLEQRGEIESTPLLLLKNFDLVWDVPIDPFHLVDHGITKYTVNCMKEWLDEDTYYEFLGRMHLCKPPSSWPRGCRSLCEVQKYKAREYMLFTVCYPMLLFELFRDTQYEGYILMTLVMTRYLDLNTEELLNLTQEQKDLLEKICDSWSFAYETIPPGSSAKVSFNFHTFGMHWNRIIQQYNGTFWQYSTEGKLIYTCI